MAFSARKLGLKAKEEFQLFTKLAGNNRGSVGFIDDFAESTHSTPVNSQMLLNSFEGSVKSAVKSGNWKKSMETGEAIIQDGWELVFKKQRADKTLPVIKHARRVN